MLKVLPETLALIQFFVLIVLDSILALLFYDEQVSWSFHRV